MFRLFFLYYTYSKEASNTHREAVLSRPDPGRIRRASVCNCASQITNEIKSSKNLLWAILNKEELSK